MRFHNSEMAERSRFVGDNLSRENVHVGKIRCEKCGWVNTVAVLPWSPQVAKVRCSHQNCGYEFEVHCESRTTGDVIEAAVEEQYARERQFGKPKAFSTETSLTAYERPSRGRDGASLTPFRHKTIDTPLGKAALIG